MSVFSEMAVDHILLYAADGEECLGWLGAYGLRVHARSREGGARTAALGHGDVRIVVCEPRDAAHPGAEYLARHGDGVADIALRVADAAAAYAEAVRRGARPVAAPRTRDGVVTATIAGFGDVTHTFVERPPGLDGRVLPGLVPSAPPACGQEGAPAAVDHFAVCVPAGRIAETTAFYRRVLDFDLTFAERVTVGGQAIETQAVQSGSRAVTLTLIEPDADREPGQIDEFLRHHGGSGVQHVALAVPDIVRAVRRCRDAGVEFLHTPAEYYRLLHDRLELVRHPLTDLRRLGVLVDEDHDGKLFQIFARSLHPRRTLFLELIERLGAQTFGGGNIKALYEAVELRRAEEGALAPA